MPAVVPLLLALCVVPVLRTQEPRRNDEPATTARGVDDAAAREALARFFAAPAEEQAGFAFDPRLDDALRTKDGDARLRELAFAAFCSVEKARRQEDHAAKRVRHGGLESAFVVKEVGTKPAGGWPLVIAMHGGGNAPKAVNDSQWRHMQIYYEDRPAGAGYLYCALRAPNDEWNGFYFDGFYPLLETLIRQFVVCDDVDPDRVIAIGYSHGGYGAFAVGPKLPHRFAAVHASASAPTDGESSPVGLHTLPFSFMVGGKDTAYGRRERCEAFAARLAELQKAWPGAYPTTFTLVEKNGHTGLPDRGLLAQLVPKVRDALPKRLAWEPTDGVVADHYWLHVATPKRGLAIDARLDGQTLSCRALDGSLALDASAGLEAWLDARLCDATQPLQLAISVPVDPPCDSVGGSRVAAPRLEVRARSVSPRPSLRTLCATLLQRGDPRLAATFVVPLP